MGQIVVMGAMMTCSFGAAPASLIVTPEKRVLVNNVPAANIMDNVPIKNIPPFGVCSSLANPTVASATSAASGVLTPMPCIPVTTAPWFPGVPTTLIANMPALDNNCKCMCTWGGLISFTQAGQFTVSAG